MTIPYSLCSYSEQRELPYVVLAVFKPGPRPWRKSRIHRALTQLTHDLGFKPLPGRAWKLVGQRGLHAEVRKRAVPGTQATGWHQDGDMDPGVNMDHAIITWANVAPTEFKVGNNIFQPKPFEVVIVRNLGVYHRRPPGAPHERWLFRQRVEVPTNYDLPQVS